MPRSGSTSRVRPARVRLSAEERKRQLAEAAALRFHHLGFHQVSMADLATTVGVTAPAIYRHYRDKQALLAAAIMTGLDEVELAITDLESIPWPTAVRQLAAVAITRRDLWILLQRELRHLDASRRAPVSKRFGLLVSRLNAALTKAAPDLEPGSLAPRVTATLAVLSSPSLYRADLPVDEYADLLACAAVAASLTDLGRDAVTPKTVRPRPRTEKLTGERGDVEPTSRSEELLRTSLELFHERGYAAVSLDDIGAAVGMAGPSVYYHFATKADLLVAAFTRATERLNASHSNRDKPADLDTLVRGYVDLGVRERLLFGVYVLEAINLPPTVGRRIKQSLERDVAAWCDALAVVRPSLTAAQRLVLVQAARGVVNDVVRIGRLHDRPRIADELRDLAWSVLSATA